MLGCKGLRVQLAGGKPVGFFQTAKELYLGLWRRTIIDLVVSAVGVIKWVKTS